MKYSNVITSKGTVTIPKDDREFLGIRPGDKVNFTRTQNGTLSMQREFTLEEVQKMNERLTRGKRRPTKAEIEEGMAQQAVERYRKSIQ